MVKGTCIWQQGLASRMDCVLGEGLDEVYHGVVGIQNYLTSTRKLARSHR
jgi:hypothetical protein